MADCGDVMVVGVIGGASAGVGAGTTALLTASSIAGGAIAGPVFSFVTFGTAIGLDKIYYTPGGSWGEITKLVLSILVGAAASFAAPSLLGFSITMGAVALVDASISAIAVGISALT